MRQHLITALIIILLHTIAVTAQSPFSTFGGNARIQALANTPFVNDISDIVLNPAYISDYRNTIFADVGYRETDNFFAATIGISKKVTISILNTGSEYYNQRFYTFPLNDNRRLAGYNTQVFSLGESVNITRNYGLLSSLDAGNIKLGLGLYYAGGFSESQLTHNVFSERKTSRDALGLQLGVLFAFSPNILLDASASLQSFKLNYTNNAPEQTMKYTALNFRTRVDIKSCTELTYTGFLNVFSLSGKQNRLSYATGSSVLVEYSSPAQFAISAGPGVTYTSENLTINGGLLIHSFKEEQDSAYAYGMFYYKTKTNSIPAIFASIEHKTFSWLTIRAGYNLSSSISELTSSNTQELYTNRSTTYANTSGFTLGAGLTFGSFNLNLYMSPNVIRYGLGNLSGNKDTFSYMSASYNF